MDFELENNKKLKSLLFWCRCEKNGIPWQISFRTMGNPPDNMGKTCVMTLETRICCFLQRLKRRDANGSERLDSGVCRGIFPVVLAVKSAGCFVYGFQESGMFDVGEQFQHLDLFRIQPLFIAFQKSLSLTHIQIPAQHQFFPPVIDFLDQGRNGITGGSENVAFMLAVKQRGLIQIRDPAEC